MVDQPEASNTCTPVFFLLHLNSCAKGLQYLLLPRRILSWPAPVTRSMSATNLSGSPSGTPGVPPNPTISAVVACRSPPTSNCYWPTSNIEVTVTQSTVIYNTTLSGGASTNSTAFLWLEVTDSTAQSATLSVSSSDAVTSVSATATAASSNTGAATSAAQSGTSSPSPGRSNDTGAIAGAAVGCFVAGALIAALISFFIFKKRAKRNRNAARGAYVPGSEPRYGGEKGTPMISVAAMGGLDFLPQQAADAEVRTKLSTVIDQIDQHVENFYNNRSIPLDANLESELSRFETSQLAQPLAACFENATNPMLLIKHCLAFHIFNLTVAPGEGTQPLLPQDLAGTVAAIYNRTVSHSASKGMFNSARLTLLADDWVEILSRLSAPGKH